MKSALNGRRELLLSSRPRSNLSLDGADGDASALSYLLNRHQTLRRSSTGVAAGDDRVGRAEGPRLMGAPPHPGQVWRRTGRILHARTGVLARGWETAQACIVGIAANGVVRPISLIVGISSVRVAQPLSQFEGTNGQRQRADPR